MLPLWLRARRTRRQHASASALHSTAFDGDTTLLPPDPIDRRHGL
jgi:hypothetical protein